MVRTFHLADDPARRAPARVWAWPPFALLLVLALTGCGPKTPIEDLDLFNDWAEVDLPRPPEPLARELNLLIWTGYIPDEIFDRFTTTYGVRFKLEYYSTNEELYTRLREPGTSYDLVMPSGYMVERLIREGRLLPIEPRQIPNFNRVDSRFFGLEFDPGLHYSLPMFYYCTGIAMNMRFVGGMPLTWEALSTAAEQPLVVGRRSMLDEMRVALGTVLIMLGESPNTTDPDAIARARDFLIETIQSGGLRFENDDMWTSLSLQQSLIAISWSGAAGLALEHNGMVRFVIPQGKCIVGADSFAIPSSARAPGTARFFLNYLLIPQITGALTNYCYYANTSSASRAYIRREISNGPGYMLPLRDNIVFLSDVGDSLSLYIDAWEQVQATPQPKLNMVPLPANESLR